MADQLLFCTACGKENRQQARFCGYCGQPLQETSSEKQDSTNEQTVEPVTPAVASYYDPEIEWATRAAKRVKSPLGKIIWGIVWALVGLFTYLWASRHSPYNPLGAMAAGGLEAYVLNEPHYTVILLAAAGLGLLGISLLVLGLIAHAKLP